MCVDLAPDGTRSSKLRAVERFGQELVRRHRQDPAAVAEDDALDAHLVEPLAAPAAWRRRDRRDDEVARAVALDDRACERGALRADTERIGGVLDVDALDHTTVAHQDGAADVELRIRRIRARSDLVRPREEVRVGDPSLAHPKAWKRRSVTSAPRSPPLATSDEECTPVSTRVCATSKAMMNVTEETRKLCGEPST